MTHQHWSGLAEYGAGQRIIRWRPAAQFHVGSDMQRLLMLLGLIMFASLGRAAVDPLGDLKKGQPKDVAAMIERIAMCIHFGGEEPYDSARSREIAAAMKKHGCERLDSDEAALRARYKNNSDVQRVLEKAHEW
jgi:hypothetical protein